ncbi:MAG: bifunctional homocysteine S-methyltransferase/methylenetetrahydrofolate reductase [Firmicutes bacterium]|nr:bifunctional homocysteine S-methyltransferase/methylenetetrahydrofolate reductase [Bacillota bacterium]
MPGKTGFKEHLLEHLLVGDGAMATWLYQQGVPIGICYEELCLTSPEMIKAVHREYYDAGARLIETNTFGANRESLRRCGLEDRVYRINRQAAVIAREAVGEDAFVFGSISSAAAGRPVESEVTNLAGLYTEQAEGLLAGEVDGIILETFTDLTEILLALEAIRRLTLLPIITQLACLEVGRTRDGYSLTEAFAELRRAGADVVGLNCRLGPAEILRSIEQAVMPPGTPISVFPNAGRLGVTDGEYSYTSSTEYFASRAVRFWEQGVGIIGGCCGTTPAHIRLVAEALHGRRPLPRVNPAPDETPRVEQRATVVTVPRPETIVDRVKKGRTVIAEFDPPKDLDIEGYLKGAALLQEAGVDAITMAENPLAQTRVSNLALGTIIKQKLGVDPLVHVTCRDRNLIGQQSHLMGLEILGINHVLVVTGDPTRFGDLPGASSVYDVSSFDLIRMVKQLNQGISFSGKQLGQQSSFVVGAAFNPHVTNFDAAIRRMEKKIESGADFIMTQPVYDAETVKKIHRSTRHLEVPIFIGIMPLVSLRNAEYLHNEVPGIRLADEVLRRMGQFSGEAARREGIRIAVELLDTAMEYFRGIYLITPFNHYQITAELTRLIKDKGKREAAREMISKTDDRSALLPGPLS